MTISDKTRRAMSDSAKVRCTPQWRSEVSARLRKFKDETAIVEMYLSGSTTAECAQHFGCGRKAIDNALRRAGVKKRRAIKRNQSGPSNANWGGSAASLVAKHKRLYRAFGQPSKCDVCGTEDSARTYDWANLTGDYDNPSDFKRMCRSCHWKYDKKHRNFAGRSQ